jgi:hypothetical protein
MRNWPCSTSLTRSIAHEESGDHRSAEAVIQNCVSIWAKQEEEQTLSGNVAVATETLADFRRSGLLAAPVPRQLGGWG